MGSGKGWTWTGISVTLVTANGRGRESNLSNAELDYPTTETINRNT
jgi:hypothetical protein